MLPWQPRLLLWSFIFTSYSNLTQNVFLATCLLPLLFLISFLVKLETLRTEYIF